MNLAKFHKLISSALVFLGVFFLLLNSFIHGSSSKHWQFYLNRVPNKDKLTNSSYEMVFDEKSLFFNSQNHTTYSINQETGSINWTFIGQDYSYFSPTIIWNFVIVANSDGYVYGLDKNTGQELWNYKVPNNTYSDTRISISDDNKFLYIGSRKGQLIALELKTGKPIWQKDFPPIDSTIIHHTDPIHFGQIWTYKNQVLIVYSPTRSLISVDQKTGQELWVSDNFAYTNSPPLFQGKYAIFKHDNSITSTNIETGVTYEENLDEIPSDKIYLQDLNLEEGIVAVFGKKINLYSSDLQNIYGETNFEPRIRWENNKSLLFNQKYNIQKNIVTINKLNLANAETTNTLSFEFSPFLISNQDGDNLILGNSSGYLVGIKTVDWQEIFKLKLDYEPIKIFNTTQGYLIVTQRPRFYLGFTLIDKSGKIIWNFNPSHPIENSSLYFHNERVYFVTSDGRQLESFKTTTKKPNNLDLKLVNFSYQLNEEDNPYLESKPHKFTFPKLNNLTSKFIFFIKHIKQAYEFKIQSTSEDGIYKIKIDHLDTLYSRPQDYVKVNVLAINKETGEKTRFNGYYSTRNLWQANFLPRETGDYQIYLLIITPYTLHFYQDSFNVATNTYNPLLVKGKNFVDSNAKIFFPLGIEDTFFDFNFDGDFSNQVPMSELKVPTKDLREFKFYTWEKHLQEFKTKSNINLYRYGVDNVTPSLTYKAVDGQFIPSLNGGSFGDNMVSSLRRNNIRVMMTIFSFYPPYDSEIEINQAKNQKIIKKYIDYVVARYSAYVDLWEVGNEANSSDAFYQFVVSYLRKIDPYQHPISTNWEEPSNEIFDYVSVHNYENPGISFAQINNTLKNADQYHADKPVIISEFGLKDVSWFEKSKTQLRITSWISMFQQIGLVIWSQGQNGIFENPNNANIYLGPDEKKILKNLINFMPPFVYPIAKEQFMIDETEIQVYTMKDDDHYAAYLLNLGQTLDQGYLTLPIPAGSKVTILDPETQKIIRTFITGEKDEKILLPKINEDLAIKAIFY